MSTEYPFGHFLADSFALLRREVPPIHREMCHRLAPHTVRLVVDDEPVAVRFASNDMHMLPDVDDPTIDLKTTRAAILDLIDARTTMLDAVLADELFLRGTPDALLAFDAGLMAYLHGAFRAPSFRNLLVTLRHDPRAARRNAHHRRHLQRRGKNA